MPEENSYIFAKKWLEQMIQDKATYFRGNATAINMSKATMKYKRDCAIIANKLTDIKR